MALIYLDQVALIDLGRKARDRAFRAQLDVKIASGAMQFVLNWWHLIESSYGKSDDLSKELAEFIQGLGCQWLLERIDILRRDVAEHFYSYARVDHVPESRLVDWRTMLDTFGANSHFRPIRFHGSIVDFITLWRKHRIKSGGDAEQVFQRSGDVRARLRQKFKEGGITSEMIRSAQLQFVQSVLPQTTPLGIAFGPEVLSDYLRNVDPGKIKGIALETIVSEFEWRTGTVGTARNQLVDGFHLTTAAPYVDEIVSRDRFFQAVYPSIKGTGHARAELSQSEDFIRRITV